jgi:hypothetical protein
MGRVVPDIGDMAESWKRSLKAQNKSPKTVDVYVSGVNRFITYLNENGMPTAITSPASTSKPSSATYSSAGRRTPPATATAVCSRSSDRARKKASSPNRRW